MTLKLPDSPVTHAFLGNVGQAFTANGLGFTTGQGTAVELDGSGSRPAQSGNGLGQFPLAVAGNAGHPQNLAAPDSEVQPADGIGAPVAAHHQVGHPQAHGTGPGGGLLDLQIHLATHHHSSEVPSAGIARAGLAGHPAVAQHRDTVAEAQDFV